MTVKRDPNRTFPCGELIQVCIGVYEIKLYFDNNLIISIIKPIALQINNENIDLSIPFEERSGKILYFLGKRASSLKIINNRILAIDYGRSSIIVNPQEDGYESFVIYHEGDTYVFR